MASKGEKQSAPGSLDDQVLRFLKEHGETNVFSLYYSLCKLNPALTRMEAADAVWRLADREVIGLEDIEPVTKSPTEFLKLWERNIWLYASIAILVATCLVIYAMPADSGFMFLRWIFGSIFVLFIPGYVSTEALFPGRGLDSIERLALSVGLSLALVPLVGLLLNFTPWGITLNAIVVSLGMLTVGLMAIAFARHYFASRRRGTETGV